MGTNWDQVNGTVGRNYLGPGTYILEVLSTTRSESRNPATKGESIYAIECRVAQVLDAVPAADGFAPSSRVDEVVSDVAICGPVGDKWGFNKAKVKNFADVILGAGLTGAEYNKALEGLFDPPGNTVKGELIMAVGSKVTTTTGGKKIVTVKYFPVPESAAPTTGA